MIVALDVGYRSTAGGHEVGRCGLVAFETWTSPESICELSVDHGDVAPYVSGRLVDRELPCLMAGLDALAESEPARTLACVLVDGNVRLDQQGAAGLGHYLHRHLAGQVPVVGVAKSAFSGLDAVEVRRGQSDRPLYVTAAGIDERHAADRVLSMAGGFRIPDLIRRADQLTRH